MQPIVVRVVSNARSQASLGQSDDTLMYAWSTDLKDGGKKAASTFGVGGTIVAVDVAQIGADWRVLAVTADGTVEVFQYDKAAGKAKKKKPSARVGSIAFTTGDVCWPCGLRFGPWAAGLLSTAHARVRVCVCALFPERGRRGHLSCDSDSRLSDPTAVPIGLCARSAAMSRFRARQSRSLRRRLLGTVARPT